MLDAAPVALIEMAQKAAVSHDLDVNLVKSIITVESNWNPKAFRDEPTWKYFFFPREWASRIHIKDFREMQFQRRSMGLMQIMGSVAREEGFIANLVRLYDPAINLEFGCRHLKRLVKRYPDEEDVISSYNQGSPRKTPGGQYFNMLYVDKVSGILRTLRALK